MTRATTSRIFVTSIDEAKAALMPKHTIENAILKGTGELGGENYETATYEGYGPGGVAVLDRRPDEQSRPYRPRRCG